MERSLVGQDYASHLSDADLRLLAPDVDAPERLRGDPAELLRRLEQPGLDRRVLSETESGWAVAASPFLIFAVLVQRASGELATMDHVPERTGLRQRVPLFDAPALREFLADPARRLFLAELLASFTRVASGRYQVRTGGRTRTRRYSELDPVRLAGLLDAVPQAERPGIYRRLGDVTLFLTGVFPDYATTRALGPLDTGRLLRAARLPADQRERLTASPAMDLWEYLGARWYTAARDLAPVTTARLAVATDVAARFRQARRVLNHLADRYLLPVGYPGPERPWFEPPAA